MTTTETSFDQAVMDAKFFGTMLKKLRKEAGMNQTELAERAGLVQGAISFLEKGDRLPSWETVLALCLALNVSCEVFRPPAEQPPPAAPPRRKRKE